MMQMRMIVCNKFERTEDGRTHARVVFDVTVSQDMCNAHNMMHGGCAAFLVDACTSVTLIVQALVTEGAFDLVSQSLNTTFHAGAKLGHTLNVVCTTVSSGKRAVSARTEIWNTTARRLVVTGNQVKMAPSRSDVKLYILCSLYAAISAFFAWHLLDCHLVDKLTCTTTVCKRRSSTSAGVVGYAGKVRPHACGEETPCCVVLAPCILSVRSI
ncbi:uncharacterized protein B0H18DRAFT_265655 [Fomitopsis serialis]|uniref:uncharacterized protein n=1 Tax=Fomitopsis serialis TaxID=139415 RepID=UPI002007F84F|nr:uncharacterized protein B0H18DRAFT_265655 [Neoantrodia serialis]KAH9928194.1 hypothetical protein B0H18DRAFT_265655 [Neoantrodia serialis]